MTSHRVFSLVFAGVVALSGAAHAAVPGRFAAGAGEIRDFVAINATVGYAATQGGGLWKTGDAGATWVKTSLAAKYVWKVSFNVASGGARLYAATDSGLYRSTDSGASWTQLTEDAARAVAVSPGSPAGGPDTVLFGVKGVGVLRSADSGATIARASSGLDSTEVVGIVFATGSSTTALVALQCNIDNPGTLSGDWGGIFRTTNANGATTWARFDAGIVVPGPPSTATHPCVNAIGVNGTAGTPLFVAGIRDPNTTQGPTYTLAGAAITWTVSAGSGIPYGVEFIGPDVSNASGFFLGSVQFGPWRSIDGGANFGQAYVEANDPILKTRTFGTGTFTSSVWLAGIHGHGLFRTTNTGANYNLPAIPVLADRVNDLANHESGLPATYWVALKNGGVYKSTNAGLNFTRFVTGLNVVQNGGVGGNYIHNVETIAAHPANGNVVALAERPYGIYQLNGTGTGWAEYGGIYNAARDHKPQSLAITPAGKVFYSLMDPGAATPGGLHKSQATGTTIGTLASAGIPLFEPDMVNIAPGAWRVRPSPSAPDTRIFMIMYDSLPYRSINGGANWARVATVDSGFHRHAFIDIAEKTSPTTTLVASTNKGIYRSTDGGANWTRVSVAGLAQTTLAALVYAPTNVLFGGDYSGQIYCSTDDGSNWLAVSGGNLGATIRDMKYMNGAVHVLTDGAGFWKKDAVCS